MVQCLDCSDHKYHEHPKSFFKFKAPNTNIVVSVSLFRVIILFWRCDVYFHVIHNWKRYLLAKIHDVIWCRWRRISRWLRHIKYGSCILVHEYLKDTRACMIIYEGFGASSWYLRQELVIASHRILCDAIIYPCLKCLFLASKSSYWRD